MLKAAIALILCVGWLAAGPFGAASQPYELIPRRTLLGNPERANPRISPDGKRVAFLAPVAGVMNVFVGPVGSIAAAKPVTKEKMRPIRQFQWALNNTHILFLQDQGGDENFAVFAVDLATGQTAKLMGGDKARAEILGDSYRHPNHILIGLNDRDPKWHDVWRVDVRTGEAARIEKNDGVAYYLADAALNLRVAVTSTADGGSMLLKRDGARWSPLLKIPADDALTSHPLSVEDNGKTLWMLDSRDRDKVALVKVDLPSGKLDVAGTDARADVAYTIADPRTNAVLAFSAEYEKPSWTAIDPSIRADLEFLSKNISGVWDVLGQSKDNQIWTLRIDNIVESVRFAAYDRASKKITTLFVARPALVGAPLSPMYARVIKARDGLNLISYLTLPKGSDPDGDGRPDKPLPMVLSVHGGPWARSSFGYDPDHHWMANRGYAVLSVNFRGSTGFGKAFVNAADREWGGKMHDDLIDAVDWAIKERIAKKDKIAIYGGSYGGYAALVGLTFTPKTFACGVSIVGPSNLNTFISSIPPYWASFMTKFKLRVGDPTTPEGRKLLTQRSPLFRADAIEKPLLIVQGANDPRIKQAESDQIAAALKKKGTPATYVLYADEGHGLARPANRLSYYAVSEAFLGKCLGGRTQPIGDDFEGSSIAIMSGKEFLPSVSEALGMVKPNE